MFTNENGKEYQYHMVEEREATFNNGTKYVARLWEDQAQNGKPIVVTNEHPTNVGPPLDEPICKQVGESWGRRFGGAENIHFYGQDIHGNMKGYPFERHERERSKVELNDYEAQAEADQIQGRERLVSYTCKPYSVGLAEKIALETAAGNSTRQPGGVDLNELQMPKDFERAHLEAEYPRKDYGPSH